MKTADTLLILSALTFLSGCASLESCRRYLPAGAVPNIANEMISSGGSPDYTLRYHECRARQGVQASQLQLAEFYAVKDARIQDFKKAAKWYKAAGSARSGNTYVYSAPVGGEKYGRVIPVQTGSSSPGDAEAQYQLGLLYLAGKGVQKSDRKARKWLARAAAQGHAAATARLSRLQEQTE